MFLLSFEVVVIYTSRRGKIMPLNNMDIMLCKDVFCIRSKFWWYTAILIGRDKFVIVNTFIVKQFGKVANGLMAILMGK